MPLDSFNFNHWRHGSTRRSVFLLVAIGMACAYLTAVAQAPITNRPPPATIIRPTPAPGAPAPAQPSVDPLANLMMSQPSIDLEAPVTVLAEFDPPMIAPGGRATYRLLVTAVSDSIKLPDKPPTPSGLALMPGGRGQTYQSLGVKLQPRTTINFRASANSVGLYTIPPYTVTAYGKEVTVPAATLNVVQPGTAGLREPPRLAIDLPEGPFYVGQTINVRVVLTDPGDGSVQAVSQVQVAGDGLLVDNTFVRQRREIVSRGGRALPSFVNDVTVTPIREGRRLLTAQANLFISRPMAGQPGVMPFYQPMVDTEPVAMQVEPLPKDGELPGFRGAIGTFLLDPPRLSTNQVRAGEPVTLNVTIKGDGNIGRLVPPKPLTLREWQMFPALGDASPPYLIQQRGSVSFNYTLVPLSDRLAATPSIPFSYFDPRRKVYADLTIPPVPIKVLPAPAGAALPSPVPTSLPAEVGPNGSEIQERALILTGLAESPGVRTRTLVPVQQRGWFLGLQLLPAVLLAGLWGWDRRRRYLALHQDVVLRKRARRGVRRHRRLARRAAAAGDGRAFITAAVNALREACAPHSAATPAALVCVDVLSELPPAERQGSPGDVVKRLFTAADTLRFGSVKPEVPRLLALKPDWENLLDRLQTRL